MMTETTENQRTAETLRDSEQTLKGILCVSPVGMVHARESRIIWANHAWEEMFGLGNEQEYIGQHASIMRPSEAKYDNVRPETGAMLRRKDVSVFDAHMRISLLDPEDPTRGISPSSTCLKSRKVHDES